MNQFNLPKKYKAVQLVQLEKIQIVDIDVPTLEKDQVLIKVEATPINPSDLGVLSGLFPSQGKIPFILGKEGSGIIIQKHESVTNIKIGDRVSFLSTPQYGTYGQYSVANLNRVILLDDDITFEAGASAIINPLTVMSIFTEVKQRGAKAIVHSAAASALGRMLVKYFQDNGIEVINIVRREEQLQLLKSEGARYVLNQTSLTFHQDLQQLSNSLEATLFFDAISGKFTGEVLELLPDNSTAYVYGNLSRSKVENITTNDLIIYGKSIRGITLYSQLHNFNPFIDQKAQTIHNNLLKTYLKTEYDKEFKLEDIEEAIQYQQSNQTQRKLLIRPNQ